MRATRTLPATPRAWRARSGLAALLLALTAAVPVARAQPAALTVSVSEDLDGGAVRERLASELRTRVVPTREGAACDLPCLSVMLDGNQAIVTFTPVRGAPRARTVELGPDPAAWPTVITLLAGNVVRDEASDVLALLPEPARAPTEQAPPIQPAELAAEVPAVPGAPYGELPAGPGAVAPSAAPGASPYLRAELLSPEQPRPSRLVGIGFVPVLSTDLTSVGQIEHAFSLDVIAGVSGGSTGLTMSGVADIENGAVSGIQLAGVTAFARRVSGTQVAGVASVSGDFEGAQIGGVAAVSRSISGAQIGGVAAIATGAADLQIGGVVAGVARGRAHMQIAGVATVADGAARMQLAGVIAAARRDTNVQGAGVAAVARSANVQAAGVTAIAVDAGVQVSGVVNVADRLGGAQIGVLNVARRGPGVQVGVINIGSAQGESFGLINIVPGGRSDLEASVDSNSLGTVLFRHGSHRWHNVYGVGGRPTDEIGDTSDDVWMYGLGFGPSFRTGSTIVDLELIGWQINHGARHYDGVSILGQLRLSAAFRIGPVSLVGGGAINTYVSSDQQSPLILERRQPDATMDSKVTVDVWPSAFVGVRI